MSKRLLSLVTGAVITMLAATSIGPAVPLTAAQDQPQAGCQLFKETGKTVCGKFLDYWKSHGDLAQQGYPISNEMREVSETDGKQYTVQYFERAVFEAHPEKQPPFDVLLSLLGTMTYKQKYPKGAQELPPDLRPEEGMTFPETGKSIRGAFLAYWKSHGGLAQQGYPITNLVSEKSDLDGNTYIVQYFERAVFEAHPEKQPPFNILLSQLGRFQYAKKYGGATPIGGTALSPGKWGGQGISLVSDGKSITLEYDCAHGTINGTTLSVNASGSFDVQGTFIFEHGGPVAPDPVDAPHAARYTGTVQGNIMTLTVTVANASPADPAATGQQVLGPYTLTLNATPSIHKCM